MGQTQAQETLQGPAAIGLGWRAFQLAGLLTAVSWLISYVFYLDGYTALITVFGLDSPFWIVGGVAYFLSPVISVVLIGIAVWPRGLSFLNRNDRTATVARVFLFLIPVVWLGTTFVGSSAMIDRMLNAPLGHSVALPVAGGAFFHTVFQHWFQGLAAIVLALAPNRFATLTESEQPAGTGAVIRDATRQMELNRRLQTLQETTRAMRKADTSEEVARIAAEAAGDILGLQSSRVHLHDDDSDELVPAAWTDATEDALGGDPPTVKPGADLVWDTFQTGDATYYPDHRGVGGENATEPSLQSSFLLPLGDHGILLAQSTEPTELTDPEIKLAHVLSATTEAALDQTEDERELELFRALLDRTSDSAFVIDPATGTLLDVNDAACRHLGYTEDELRAMTVADIIPAFGEDDETDIRTVLEEARARSKLAVGGEYRRKDGSTFPVDITVHHVELDQEYLLAIISDMTERNEERSLLSDIQRNLRTKGSGSKKRGDEVVLPAKADCLQSIRRHRWPDRVTCPHCDSADTIKKGTTSKDAQRYQCHNCDSTFNDLTGTIFAEHRLSLPEMFYIIREMEEENTAQIARQLDRSYQSVLDFVHEVQEASDEEVEFTGG